MILDHGGCSRFEDFLFPCNYVWLLLKPLLNESSYCPYAFQFLHDIAMFISELYEMLLCMVFFLLIHLHGYNSLLLQPSMKSSSAFLIILTDCLSWSAPGSFYIWQLVSFYLKTLLQYSYLNVLRNISRCYTAVRWEIYA